METSPLVSTEWLAEHLSAPDIRILDGSWYLAADKRDALAEYKREHIPGAILFDIDLFSDQSSPYPHMLPAPAEFAARAKSLGIGDGHRIVTYDTAGLFSAARVWWMFRVMGHNDVAVLDGGFPKWKREKHPVDDMVPVLTERHFMPRPNHALVRDAGQVKGVLATSAEKIVDVRSAERFQGKAPEPRPGVHAGHVPGATNLPYKELVASDGTLLKGRALEAKLASAGVSPNEPVVAMCGSGVTAAILALALTSLGSKRVSVYDGSWAEWGSRADLPIATGP
ncbi:MAG: 3-mercaptopyruvate sulfurtransferase [Alphaproteobacteria bacterium]